MRQIVREAARRVGGVPALAERLGVTRQAVYQWKNIPIEKVGLVAKETGLAKSELRPDVFSAAAEKNEGSVYDRDFVAWADFQAKALRHRDFSTLDIVNLSDEVEDMASRHRDEIENREEILLTHLLKWMVQPEKRSSSWEATLLEQRSRILKRIRRSPSLKPYPEAVLADEYALARRKAALETGLPIERFPIECPFDIDQILDLDFLPATEAAS